jgi:hypothetical protein
MSSMFVSVKCVDFVFHFGIFVLFVLIFIFVALLLFYYLFWGRDLENIKLGREGGREDLERLKEEQTPLSILCEKKSLFWKKKKLKLSLKKKNKKQPNSKSYRTSHDTEVGDSFLDNTESSQDQNK